MWIKRKKGRKANIKATKTKTGNRIAKRRKNIITTNTAAKKVMALLIIPSILTGKKIRPLT